MNGRLSSSVLLKQIIPKTNTSTVQKESNQKCQIRKIQPAELVLIQKENKAESLLTEELLEKIKKIKESSEYANILKGAKLGLSAYQKPSSGIPLSDLSKEIKLLLAKTEQLINDNSEKTIDFGKVTYNEITKKINFYAANDVNLSKVLGSLDTTKFTTSSVIDKALNLYSTHAISNSAVTQRFKELESEIPNINIFDETLNIEKNE